MASVFDIPWLMTASKKRRYLVGVSGGADSVALLHLLVEAGFENLVVCHLDHRLRGKESAADARFVGRLAKQLGLACELGREDVKRRMKEAGESMETAARHARHAFFAECAMKYRCTRVLLAHHADDQAETVMWNLLRGSRGLKGMSEEQGIAVGKKSLTLMRPLLGARHAELVKWLEQHGLTWREDASNAQAVAVRNRLRNEVMPLLADISGRDVVAALVRGAADSEEQSAFEMELVEQANVLDPQGRLHLPTLRKLHPVVQRAALRDYLIRHGVPSIDRALLDRALSLIDVSNAAVVNLPGGQQLRRREGRLEIRSQSQETRR